MSKIIIEAESLGEPVEGGPRVLVRQEGNHVHLMLLSYRSGSSVEATRAARLVRM